MRAGTQFLLVPIGGVFIFIGYRMTQKQTKEKQIQKQKEEQAKSQTQQGTASPDQDKISLIDNLSLELGYALIPLVNKEKGAELLERISRIRTEARHDIGLDIPKIRIQDNIRP